MKALVPLEKGLQAMLRSAASVWADSTTRQTSFRRADLLRDKLAAVSAFFAFAGKHPAEVTPVDARAWRSELERQGLKPATVYARLSRLSSFYEWAIQDARLGEALKSNPVRLARPKAPRAYQTESTRSLTDEQVRRLVALLRAKAEQGSVVAKRDYALLLFYLVTGMRRSEVINLRGRDLEEREGVLMLRGRVKGSDYVERVVRDGAARAALRDYLEASGRLKALKTDSPLWTRHDRAGKLGAALTSHALRVESEIAASRTKIEQEFRSGAAGLKRMNDQAMAADAELPAGVENAAAAGETADRIAAAIRLDMRPLPDLLPVLPAKKFGVTQRS